MFRILYTNMTKIAPTGCAYAEDEAVWLSYAMQQMKAEYPEYILMYKDKTLIGYFQYSIDGNTLMADEVEIISEYQTHRYNHGSSAGVGNVASLVLAADKCRKR